MWCVLWGSDSALIQSCLLRRAQSFYLFGLKTDLFFIFYSSWGLLTWLKLPSAEVTPPLSVFMSPYCYIDCWPELEGKRTLFHGDVTERREEDSVSLSLCWVPHSESWPEYKHTLLSLWLTLAHTANVGKVIWLFVTDERWCKTIKCVLSCDQTCFSCGGRTQ